jgi:hypothetical protein
VAYQSIGAQCITLQTGQRLQRSPITRPFRDQALEQFRSGRGVACPRKRACKGGKRGRRAVAGSDQSFQRSNRALRIARRQTQQRHLSSVRHQGQAEADRQCDQHEQWELRSPQRR